MYLKLVGLLNTNLTLYYSDIVMTKPRICGVMTKAFGIKAFMLENLKYVVNHGCFDGSFICERTEEFPQDEIEPLQYIPIDIRRGNVSPLEVIKCTYTLYKLFRKHKFDIIQYASSNAGLYAAIAGRLAKVPVRIYCQWGISYTDYTGIKLLFYKLAEKITCYFATHVQPDSYANLEFAISEKLYKRSKGSVIGKGSASGVDMKKYDISRKDEWRCEIRKRYHIPEDVKVFGYVGRLVPEKGINELLEAFLSLTDMSLRLLIVGPEYEIERLDQSIWNSAHSDSRIIFCGSKDNTAPYYAAMDFLVLPSYREGFGSVVLEAGALGVPCICSNINGPTEFVKHQKTGLVCDPKSVSSLKEEMGHALDMGEFEYNTMKNHAYDSVKQDFDADVYRKMFLNNRLNILKNK